MTGRKHARPSGLLLVAAGVSVIGVVWLLLALPVLASTSNWGQDFDAYRAASVRLAEEGTLYKEASLRSGFEPQGQGLYLYPPPLGIAIGPLTTIPADTGAIAWYVLKVGALALACLLMPVRPATRLLAFSVSVFGFAVLRDLIMGNVSILLLIPLAAGWRWLDRPAGSIALAIATSVRATMGAFLLWFLVRRAWGPLAWMVAAGIAIVLLSVPFVGIEGYRDYVTLLANVSGTTDLLQNRHLTRLVLELGVPAESAWLALLPAWALGLAAIALSRRRDAETGYLVTAGTTLLLAPLMWDHYLAMLLLPAAFLFERGRPWAILLPLLTWLPAPLLPLVAVAAVLLPFLARDPATHGHPAAAPASAA